MVRILFLTCEGRGDDSKQKQKIGLDRESTPITNGHDVQHATLAGNVLLMLPFGS